MKVEIKDINNKSLETINLTNFNLGDYNHLLHERNRLNNNLLRSGNQSAKTRSEVSVSGKKVYKQKGTGNARRGANSTPLRRGGGCIFAPKPRSYSFKINKKINKKLMIFVANFILKNSLVLQTDLFSITKTKEIKSTYNEIIKNSLFIFTEDDITYKVFKNLKNLEMILFSQLNIQKVLLSNQFIITSKVYNELKKILNIENNDG